MALSLSHFPLEMNRNQEKVRAQSISSTPIVRIKGVRESLGRIKQNTVSGMVKLFSKQKKVIEIDSPTEVDHKSSQDDKLIVRQISFFNDLSSINQASEYDLKLQSPDSGYDSFAFRARSSSVNASSINNQSRAFLAHYAKYPNFKWDYLKYFGEDPKEYLSRHNIDLDTICEDDSRYRHTIGRNNERSVANNNSFDGMRKRSQSFNSKSVCKQATPSVKYPNNTNFKVSNVKYFGVDSSQRYNSVYMGNEQKKIVSPKETYSADCRKNISNNAIGNLQQKPLNGGSVAQIQELNEEVVDSDIGMLLSFQIFFLF